MKPKAKQPYCYACLYCAKTRCEVLGEIDETAIKLCKSAGYKLQRPSSWSTIRIYNNKTGAL